MRANGTPRGSAGDAPAHHPGRTSLGLSALRDNKCRLSLRESRLFREVIDLPILRPALRGETDSFSVR
jgi:hypothetical protein